MPFTIQDILTLKDGRRRVWGFLMVVSYTVFLVMKFLTLKVWRWRVWGFLMVVSYNANPHAQSRQIESVRKYQFKELALSVWSNCPKYAII